MQGRERGCRGIWFHMRLAYLDFLAASARQRFGGTSSTSLIESAIDSLEVRQRASVRWKRVRSVGRDRLRQHTSMKNILTTTITALALGVAASSYAAEYSVFKVCNDRHVITTSDGEQAGHIEYIVVDPESHAVVSTVIGGGFLGDRFVSVPADDFSYENGDAIVLHNVTRERLVSAPVFERDRIVEGGRIDPTYFGQSFGYWGRQVGVRAGGREGVDAAVVRDGRNGTIENGRTAVEGGVVETGREGTRATREAGRTGTEAAREGARTSAEAAREAGRNGAEAAREGTKASAEAAREAGRTGAEAAREGTKASAEAAREAGRTGAEAAREGTKASAEAAREAGRTGAEAAREGTKASTEAAREAGRTGAEAAREGTKAGAETTRETGRAAGETARESGRAAGEAAHETKRATEGAAGAAERGARSAEGAAEKKSE